MSGLPVFTYCGADLFAPFHIKERRSMLKKYGEIFTCLSCRAIHIESVNSMETDSFIQSFRRFIARIGSVRMIRCDNGTNFVRARNLFQREMKQLDHEKIQRYLLHSKTDWIIWKHNSP